MNAPTQAKETPPAPDLGTVPVVDLDQFVRMLAGWHGQKVAELNHMLTVPEGTKVLVDDGPPLVLAGDARKGFLAGLNTALAALGQLPFVAEIDDHPDAPHAAA